MALQMISFGLIMPIFARRLGDFGAGVEALGLMAIAYSVTSIAASPFMGSLADRIGRRPLILGSLVAYWLPLPGIYWLLRQLFLSSFAPWRER